MKLSEKTPWPVLALLALVALLEAPRIAGAVKYSEPGNNYESAAASVTPTPPTPSQCSPVVLDGGGEAVWTGTTGRCYRINTTGVDIYDFQEPASGFDGGTASTTTAARLPDPGVEKSCLITGNTKIHFYAAAATTAVVCQTGP